jgi:hypothetical protein
MGWAFSFESNVGLHSEGDSKIREDPVVWNIEVIFWVMKLPKGLCIVVTIPDRLVSRFESFVPVLSINETCYFLTN